MANNPMYGQNKADEIIGVISKSVSATPGATLKGISLEKLMTVIPAASTTDVDLGISRDIGLILCGYVEVSGVTDAGFDANIIIKTDTRILCDNITEDGTYQLSGGYVASGEDITVDMVSDDANGAVTIKVTALFLPTTTS